MKKIISLLFILCINGFVFADKERHGGFEFINARKLLEIASSELSQQILQAQEVIFPPFPQDWTCEKFAFVIQNVRFEYERESQGINEQERPEKRMFDYGVEEKTGEGYISALKPYFSYYAHVPAETDLLWVQDVIYDIKIKLFHETLHLVWDFSELEADLYARAYVSKLELNHSAQKQKVLNLLFSLFREEFKVAKMPTLNTLKLGESWVCFYFDILENYPVKTREKKYVFEEAGGLILDFSSEPPQNFGTLIAQNTLVTSHIQGNVGERIQYREYVRITEDNRLMVEVTKKNLKSTTNDNTLEHFSSLIEPTESVIGYFMCSQ